MSYSVNHNNYRVIECRMLQPSTLQTQSPNVFLFPIDSSFDIMKWKGRTYSFTYSAYVEFYILSTPQTTEDDETIDHKI